MLFELKTVSFLTMSRNWSIGKIFNFLDGMFVAFSSKLGYEEHIPGQTRDWNEELQTTRELPRKNLPDRLLRERAIFKVCFKDEKVLSI